MSDLPKIKPTALDALVQRALVEDLSDAGDVTSDNILEPGQAARAWIISKAVGVLAGTNVAEAVFLKMDPTLKVEWEIDEGGLLEPGAIIGEVAGLARSILAAERVALNFLQHLTGVATLTAAYVDVCKPYGVQLLCTRKTIPGLRAVQRYAAAVGGGKLHRAGLYDAILIKTNHCKLAGGITEAVKRAKSRSGLPVEVEVETLAELKQAAEAGAERVLLDNADLNIIADAVREKPEGLFLEVSGGVSLDNVEAIAALRPDAISVGKITHSAPAIDLALHVVV